MKKTIKIIALGVLGLVLLSGTYVWYKLQKQKKAQAITDHIMENLTSPDIYEYFPKAYFTKMKLEPIVNGLRKNCDWENRDGKFVDFFSHMDIGGIDQTAFIYEYYLDCDSLRFILSVNMEFTPELMGFHLEALEKENPMILYPSKQLKNRRK